ncbi:MAG TPA: CesT family type III secretion system chaperone [Sunxiuqinia sp.]|nr:CesT family type III secretion system chaperone [Sunxiuqinia sp.]
MSENFDKVKSFLLELEYSILSEDLNEELFIIEKDEAGITNLVVDCEDPILVIECVLFELKNKSADVLEKLLIKNREIIHGAFALDASGKKVIFRDTLQLENLDLNELEGTLNSLELLLSEYGADIIEFSKN